MIASPSVPEVRLVQPIIEVRLVRDAEKPKVRVKRAEDVVELCKDMRSLDREHFRALYLDSRNGLLGMETVAIGTLNATMIHAREVFKAAFLLNAAAVVLVHNHPSGDPTPSNDDVKMTKQLVRAGNLLGIEVLDHIIIGEGWRSLVESEAAPKP